MSRRHRRRPLRPESPTLKNPRQIQGETLEFGGSDHIATRWRRPELARIESGTSRAYASVVMRGSWSCWRLDRWRAVSPSSRLCHSFLRPLRGQSVTLVWNPSTNTDVVGYNLYYGGATQTYTNMASVGDVTNATISGLIAGDKYFFAATAVDSAGLEGVLERNLVSGSRRTAGPAPPPITWPTPADIVYGTALGAGQLNATSSVPGIFTTIHPPARSSVPAPRSSRSLSTRPTQTAICRSQPMSRWWSCPRP